ncbi:MAG: 3-dehydroquinate synthase [bacterium]|nr:3-dehydroquinate synthase [bacterium]
MTEAPQHLDLVHRGGSTRIWLGAGALANAASEVSPWLAGRRLFVISSARVRRLHRDSLRNLVADAVDVVELEVADGESAKSLTTVERLTREMLVGGGKRDSRAITLGGGTVGDVGGFAAGCFLRGIEYVQIPTTLLGQADAAIGGKTGVNLPEAKNSVGLFHQPRWVICDPSHLSTLPAEETRQAIFEIVKAAILADESLFELIESNLDGLLSGDADLLARAVRSAVEVKVEVVAADEREGDQRRLLNLGHTLGHALETVVGHGKLRHGDAVGHGLMFAVALAEQRDLAPEDARRIRVLLDRLELPELPDLTPASVLEAMQRDKKARESGLGWVLPLGIGCAEVVVIPMASVERQLASFLGGS